MKTAIALSLLLVSFASPAAKITTYICDASVAAGLGEETTKVLASQSQSTTVSTDGRRFQSVYGEIVLTSPYTVDVGEGIRRGVSNGVAYVMRDGTYQVSNDGNKWLVFDNCKKAG